MSWRTSVLHSFFMYSDSLEHWVQPWMLAHVGWTKTLRGLQRAVVAALHRNGQEDPFYECERKVTEWTSQRQSRCTRVVTRTKLTPPPTPPNPKDQSTDRIYVAGGANPPVGPTIWRLLGGNVWQQVLKYTLRRRFSAIEDMSSKARAWDKWTQVESSTKLIEKGGPTNQEIPNEKQK